MHSKRYLPTYKPTGWILAASMLAVAVFFTSCSSFKHLTTVESTFPQASMCGKCHIDIYREWTNSPHARAFTHPPYRRATDDYRFSDCLGCHAPEPRLSESAPSARSAFREEGVTCVSCHLDQGKLAGPLDLTGTTTPHPVTVQPDRYRQSRFCGRCHEGTFDEWSAAVMPEKPSCQACHMPQTRRKITQATGTLSRVIVAFEDQVMQKQHTFDALPAKLQDEPVSVDVRREAEHVKLIVHNHLPHFLPTGDFGPTVLVLEVFAIDADAREAPIGKWELIKQLRTAIPPRSSIERPIPIPTSTRSLRVRLSRKRPEQAETAELFNIEVSLP